MDPAGAHYPRAHGISAQFAVSVGELCFAEEWHQVQDPVFHHAGAVGLTLLLCAVFRERNSHQPLLPTSTRGARQHGCLNEE